MNLMKSIVRNSAILLAGQIMSKVLMYIITIIIAQKLGVEGFGAYSFSLSFAVLFYALADFGLTTVVIRKVASDHNSIHALWSPIIRLKTLLAVFTLTSIFGVITFLGYSWELRLASLLAGVYFILESFNDFCAGIFRTYQRTEFESIANILEKVLLLVAIVYLPSLTVVWVLILSLIAIFIRSIIMVFSIMKLVQPKTSKEEVSLLRLVKEGLPLSFMILLSIAMYKIDVTMISQMQGIEAVGLYAAASNIILGLLILPAVFSDILFPILSSFKARIDALKESLHIAIKFLSVIIIPLCIVGFFLSEKIILSLYGVEYQNSIMTLQVLFITFFFGSIIYVQDYTLIVLNQLRFLNTNFLIGIGCNVILNYFLIPYWGIIGAAVATLISHGIHLLINLVILKKNDCLQLPIGKQLLGGTTMILFIYFMPLPIFFSALLSLLIYVFTMYILKFVTSRDKELISEIFQ